MSTFAVELLESVRRDGKLRFYSLIKDGNNLFDSFYNEVSKEKRHKSDLIRIIATMDFVAENDAKLPKERVNSIKDGDKVIGLEFKKNDLRVYCLKLEPNVVVIMGGYKKNQKKDLKTIKQLLKDNKDLPEIIVQEILKLEQNDYL